MKNPFVFLLAAAILSAGLVFAAPATETATADSAANTAVPAAETLPAAAARVKAKRTFTRMTWRDRQDRTWWSSEAVRVTPVAGRTRVFRQIEKNGRWVNVTRQTTFANGVFDFGTYSEKRSRALRTKFYDVKFPDRYYVRVLVRGDADHRRLVSPSWMVSWG